MWLKKIINRFAKSINWKTTRQEYIHLDGTRNTILGKCEDDFYKSDAFRLNCTKHLRGKLYENEVIYGEIVGYTASGTPIMSPQDTTKLKDKKITKQYGDLITYSYGCNVGECKFYVYRINQNGKELSDGEMRIRCGELELECVPLINRFECHNEYTKNDIVKWCDGTVNGTGSEALPSSLDKTHPLEGVVVRVDHTDYGTHFLKYKSFYFGIAEGYLKDQTDYIDTEEVS